VVVCGPGNIEQAHSNDEWISRRELHAAHRMYLHAAEQLCVEHG
jgi:acetylornithine deacetylase/succinyl-diaminopimelate desuccinylase